jgi:stage III sporulation protein AE
VRRLVWLLIALLFLALPARADELEKGLENVLDSLSISEFQKAVDSVTAEPIDVKDTVLKLARGEITWDFGKLLESLGNSLLSALTGSLWRITRVLVPAVLCGILMHMRGAFARDAVAEISRYVCFLLVAIFMVQDLTEHIALAQRTIDLLSGAMQNLFPLLLTLLAAVGGTASAAFFQPAVVAASGTMTSLIRNVTMPFAVGAAVLIILDHVSEKLHVSRLASLFKQMANWTLGVSFTVFIGVTMVQGLGTAAVDGVSIRTAKYAIDNFVPIVGGMFADTVDTLVGCSLLIKNALGTTGLMVLVGICISPMIQSLCAVLIYRLSAAILQPVAESSIVDCLYDFSNVLMLLFIIQLSISAMFLLLIAQMLVVGNLTVMLR